MPGRAKGTRLADQPQGDRGGDEIADHRDQSDQAVDAVADIGAGQDEGDVQELGQRVEPRQPLLAGEIGERVGAGEIEPEAVRPRAQLLARNLAPFLIDHGTERLGTR